MLKVIIQVRIPIFYKIETINFHFVWEQVYNLNFIQTNHNITDS